MAETKEPPSNWGRSLTWEPEFSNCFEPPCPITIDGQIYASTEHYYQSRKFHDAASIDYICSRDRPISAKFAARKVAKKAKKQRLNQNLRELPELYQGQSAPIDMIPPQTWDEIKESIMFQATFAKYRQHQELRQLLLSTDDRPIVEPNRNDEYWGCGRDGTSGQNRLRHVLMQVRSVLAKERGQQGGAEETVEK